MKITTLTREEFKNRKKSVVVEEDDSHFLYARCPFCFIYYPISSREQVQVVIQHALNVHPYLYLSATLSGEDIASEIIVETVDQMFSENMVYE